MRKIFFFSLSIGLFAHNLNAQQITMYKTFGGIRFMQGDSLLIEKEVAMALKKENTSAYSEFKKAKVNQTISSAMGFAGGFLIAFPLGTAIVGGEPEWGLAAGGAALLLGSIPFNRIYKARTLHALDLHNEKKTSRINTRFYFAGNQAGLVVKF